MTLIAPPRPPRSDRPSEPLEREEIEALVEALIEEARQRARRRRRIYASVAGVVGLAVIAAFAILDRTVAAESASPWVSATPSGLAATGGSKIAFVRSYPNRAWGQVYVMNADGTGQRMLARTREVGSSRPSWSRDAQKIAFTRAGGEGAPYIKSDVYVMNADGSGLQRLTRNGGNDLHPAWSPDGQRIAYGSYRNSDDRSYIYVMNADGSEKRQLTHGPGLWLDGRPAWSPDGERIAFTRWHGRWSKPCRASCDDVYVINADGSAPLNLTPGMASGNSPVWSPDGRTIAFQSDPDRDGNSEIYLVNADGSGRVTRTPGGGVWSVAWSPDGRRIAFTRQSGIYVMNANGTEQRRLTKEGSDPVWSPDGRTIAFQGGNLGLDSGIIDSGIFVVNADGSGQRRLTHGTGGWFDWLPAWSPQK